MTDPNVCLIFGVYSKYFDGKMYKAGTRGVLVALSLASKENRAEYSFSKGDCELKKCLVKRNDIKNTKHTQFFKSMNFKIFYRRSHGRSPREVIEEKKILDKR